MTPLNFLAGLTAISLALPSDAFVAPGRAGLFDRLPSGVLRSSSRSCARVGPRASFGLHGVDNGFCTRRVPLGLVELGTVVSRGVDSRCRRPAAATGALKAVSETGSEEQRDLSGLRRTLFLTIWAPLFLYAFGPWSPGSVGDPADTDLIINLYDPAVAGPRTAIFSAIFSSFPALTTTLLSILCGGGSFSKGRQPVPPQPFVFGATALGFFAVGPYLALRNYLPEMEAGEEPTLLERIFTSKLLALPLLGGSVVCAYNFLVALSDPAAVSSFSELFWVSRAAHVSTLDLIVLSVTILDPLREDMRRRGWEPEAAKVALFSVPVVGPALWLLVRPAVVRP